LKRLSLEGLERMKGRAPSIVDLAAAISIAVAVLCASGCADCDLRITTGALPDAAVDVDYAFHLDSDCGGDVWFIDGGTLPPGIGLQEDGDLRGTPTVGGQFVFTVGVFDFSSNERASKGFSIRVAEAP
jgi:Putative Ig domain